MSSPPVLAATAVLLAAVAGGIAGVLTAWWLARLRRGARVRPWWCVLGVGLLWATVAAAWTCGAVPGAVLPLLAGLCWLTVAGSVVDLAVHRLPDALTLPAAPAVVALLVPLGGAAVGRGALSAVLLCGAHGMVRLASPTAMGGGDVKLAAAVGAALGGVSWSAVLWGTLLAAVLTAAFAACSVAASAAGPAGADRGCGGTGPCCAGAPGRSRPPGTVACTASEPSRGRARAPVPHGPSMLVAGLATVVMAAIQ